MRFTPEQTRAIETQDTNLIVTAGAGSGKTLVLVERFVYLLETNPDWSVLDIVAITFTEKAAREMRERVRQRIRAKVQASRTPVEHRHWTAHENNLDSARISTIHGLCKQLLQANPVEAGVDPRFDVLDEVEAATLQDTVIEQVLSEVVAEDHPAATLLPLYEVRTVRAVLKALIRQGWIDEHLAPDQEPAWLLEKWDAQRRQRNQAVIKEMRQDSAFISALPTVSDAPADDKLGDICRLVVAYQDQITQGTLDEVLEALQAFDEHIKLNVGSKKNWGDEAALKQAKKILGGIREAARAYLPRLAPPLGPVDEETAQLTVHWHALLANARQRYQAAKDERQLLDFDDLEQMTRHLLVENPAVATRYAHPYNGQFKHIMVDEFQDTNSAQRSIIYALAGINIDKQTAPAGRLFVVGDPKQSIYAFRGADVSVFQQVRDEIIQAGGQPITLSQSFRAHQRLVAVFNQLFDTILNREKGLASSYSVTYGKPMTAHRPSEDHHHAPVHLIVLQQPEDADRFYAEDFRQWEAHEIATRLQRMVSGETLVYDKAAARYRSVLYQDIAILFRAMTNVQIYEEAFQAVGLPYLTVAGRGYFEQQEVWDLRNLLLALHNPANDLALASALRSPLFGFSDDLLLALRLRTDTDDRPLPLWQALFSDDPASDWPSLPGDETERVELARQVLGRLRGLAGRVTINELLAQALDLTGFEATLVSLPGGQRRRANILKFLDVARRSQRVSLGAFNAYLDEVVAAEAREGEATLEPEGAVTLMSVHRSKGLEFPVVVLADASYGGRSRGETVQFTQEYGLAAKHAGDSDQTPFIYTLSQQFNAQREASEEKRLLYVGATRAQDYLIISGRAYGRSGRADWLSQLSDLLEISSYAPEDSGLLADYDVQVTVTQTPLDGGTGPSAGPDRAPDTDLFEEALASPPPEETPAQIPLLAPMPRFRPPIRHINASALETLGRVEDERWTVGVQDFRRQVLRGAPGPVRPLVTGLDPQHVPAYVLGNVVHRALQTQLVEGGLDAEEQRAILAGYAWQEGLTHKAAVQHAVDEAQTLLARYARSDIRHQLADAEQVYKEVSFALRKGDYTIHGVIDVLFMRYEYGQPQWVILDYKTDNVPPGAVGARAKHYVYQMGAYAAAIEEKTGQVPRVVLYFLHPDRAWEIREDTWRPALEALPLTLTELLSGEAG